MFSELRTQRLRKRFQLGHWSFLGFGEEAKWYGTHNYKPEGQWKCTADIMVSKFVQISSFVETFSDIHSCVGSWPEHFRDVCDLESSL